MLQHLFRGNGIYYRKYRPWNWLPKKEEKTFKINKAIVAGERRKKWKSIYCCLAEHTFVLFLSHRFSHKSLKSGIEKSTTNWWGGRVGTDTPNISSAEYTLPGGYHMLLRLLLLLLLVLQLAASQGTWRAYKWSRKASRLCRPMCFGSCSFAVSRHRARPFVSMHSTVTATVWKCVWVSYMVVCCYSACICTHIYEFTDSGSIGSSWKRSGMQEIAMPRNGMANMKGDHIFHAIATAATAIVGNEVDCEAATPQIPLKMEHESSH